MDDYSLQLPKFSYLIAMAYSEIVPELGRGELVVAYFELVC